MAPDHAPLSKQQMAFSLHAAACAQAASTAERRGDVAAAAEWSWCHKKCRDMIEQIERELRGQQR